MSTTRRARHKAVGALNREMKGRKKKVQSKTKGKMGGTYKKVTESGFTVKKAGRKLWGRK